MLLILFLIGLVFLTIGIWGRNDGFKALYLVKGIPGIMPAAVRNMFIPFGITLLTLGIIMSGHVESIETRQDLFSFVVMPMMFVSLILGAWTPKWLQPQWLVYLEDEYGSVMWKLLEEARKDVPNWEKRVRTQEGLEAWAEETRIKLGYPPHPGQIERQA